MVFDARTGRRLDPLSDEHLTMVANEALEGGRLERLADATEYNRYYAADRVPAARATLGGAQPATLIPSRDEDERFVASTTSPGNSSGGVAPFM